MIRKYFAGNVSIYASKMSVDSNAKPQRTGGFIGIVHACAVGGRHLPPSFSVIGTQGHLTFKLHKVIMRSLPALKTKHNMNNVFHTRKDKLNNTWPHRWDPQVACRHTQKKCKKLKRTSEFIHLSKSSNHQIKHNFRCTIYQYHISQVNIGVQYIKINVMKFKHGKNCILSSVRKLKKKKCRIETSMVVEF